MRAALGVACSAHKPCACGKTPDHAAAEVGAGATAGRHRGQSRVWPPGGTGAESPATMNCTGPEPEQMRSMVGGPPSGDAAAAASDNAQDASMKQANQRKRRRMCMPGL